jgi:hypothetical protein
MRSKLGGPFQIVFRTSPPSPAVAEAPPAPALIPLVELTVFSGDSLACGQLALSAHRVTDLMNDHEAFEFVDTSLQSLDDGHQLLVPALTIARDEIFAVAVSGPRGDPVRRTRTRPMPVELRLGRYDVSGNIHVVPGTDPISSFRRRKVMVPLTEATIGYDSSAGRIRSNFHTILVNGLLADWIAAATRSDVRPPELVPKLAGRGLARDFTPQLRVG